MVRFSPPVPFVKSRSEANFIDFAEVRLELGYDYGVVGGVEFKTEIVEVRDGREQRNALRQLPLGRWQLGQRDLLESEADKIAEISYLRDFQQDRLGAKQGFRFKDWADYRATDQLIAIGDGQKNQFQLRKAYQVGDAVTYRPIQKPVVGTVILYVDSVVVDDWDIDYINGVVSHTDPLPDGAALRADFEFDVPVWFESDQLPMSSEFVRVNGDRVLLYKLGSVFVVEGRIPLTLPWEIAQTQEITEDLNLGIVYQTTEKTEFSTQKIALKNGYTARQEKREESRILFDFGNRKFNQQELDTLLAFFWNSRGKTVDFPLTDKGNNYKVRFNSDRLNIKFEAASNSDALFSVSGLKLQLEEQTLYRAPPYQFDFDSYTVNPEDPEDPLVTENNPGITSNRYYEHNTGETEAGEKRIVELPEYQIKNYRVASVLYDYQLALPPETMRYVAAQLFWAADALWLLITSQGSLVANNNWYNRCALFRLSNSGFQFVESDIKDYYSASFSNGNLAKVFKTPTGISVFCPADNSVAFGSGRGGNASGILRFEIRNDGSQFFDFIESADFGYNLFSVIAVLGNRVYVNASGTPQAAVVSLGTINGLEYVAGNFGTGQQGFPVGASAPSNSANITTKETEPNNWYSGTSGKQRLIYHNGNLIETYHTINTSTSGLYSPDFQYVEVSTDGSILARIYEYRVCPDNTCGFGDSRLLTFSSLWLQPDITSDLIPLPKLPLFNGDAFNFIATSNNLNATRITHDKYGNMMLILGNRSFFYRSGADHAIETSGLTGGNLKCNEAVTPYGFGIFAHEGYLFETDSNPVVIFVQP